MASSDPKSAPDSTGGSQGALIFMSDASAEAERLSGALRARSYWVVDVPLGLLAGRVAVQRPAVVICDADAPGTLETMNRMQIAAGGRAIDVLLIAESTEAPSEGRTELERQASGVFTRPVDPDELVRKIEQIIGPPGSRPSSPSGPVSAGRSPVLVTATRRPYRYEGPKVGARGPGPLSGAPPPALSPSVAPSGPPSATSSAPPAPPGSTPSSAPSVVPPSARTSSAPPGGLPPARGGSVMPQAIGAVPHARLSPELELLLGRAEQRVRSSAGGPALAERLSPDAEVEAVLPADLLAALDEPLEADDDDDGDDSVAGTAGGSESGSRGTRGTPEPGTATGGRTVSRAEGTANASFRSEATSSAGPRSEPTSSALGNTRGDPKSSSDHPQFANEPPTAPPARPIPVAPQSVRMNTALELDPPVESRPGGAESRPGGVESRPGAITNAGSDPSPSSAPVIEAPSTRPPRPDVAPDRRQEPTFPYAASKPLQPEPSDPQPIARAVPDISPTLGSGGGLRALARAVAARFTGAIAFEDATGIRRVVFRDGDFVTAASSAEGETLVAFLAQRGDLAPDAVQRVGRRLPPFGRHAGAALVAQGHLRQDELWAVLRAHAEWLIARVAGMQGGAASLEHEVPQRLQTEPGVFGGATGAEVLVEITRRVAPPADAVARLGGRDVRFGFGGRRVLLAECALSDAENALAETAEGATLGELLKRAGADDFACVAWALVELGILSTASEARRPAPTPEAAADPDAWDPLDTTAFRARVAARRALVEEGDYFALLGVSRTATHYDLRRAYQTLRRDLDPSRMITAATIDLREDVDSILEVIDEAYDILRDPVRRERYRRALDAAPR
ncbi:MAG TPA: DnaJ domain-containing protein [Polyangiaceae bacterium]